MQPQAKIVSERQQYDPSRYFATEVASHNRLSHRASPQSEHFDPSLLSDAELDIAEALIAKATGRQPRKPETLARIAEG
jgi:hypothetical protein